MNPCIRYLKAALAFTFAIAMITWGVLLTVVLGASTAQTHAITAHLQSELNATVKSLRKANLEISVLTTSLTQLTVPADPLSAYSDICNAQLTDDATGITQTFYYPCTNNAMTIPQPGN